MSHLQQINLSVKKRLAAMYFNAKAGHIGVSLSCCELMTHIHFDMMGNTDEFILSKGHAAALLYSVLAEKGVLSEADIQTFYKENTYLPAHPPANKIKGISFATGSLGHGLSLAAGLALAYKLKKINKTVFCLTSDGELNEGSIWEAAMFINHHQLHHVYWYIDRNHLQGFGKTEEVMQLDPLDKKLEAFGFKVHIIDGHDFEALHNLKKQFSHTQANVVIANTIKGKGWQRLENTVDCHYVPFTNNDYEQFIQSMV